VVEAQHSEVPAEATVSALELARSFAELAQRLSSIDAEQATFEAIVDQALLVIPGVEAAGITVVRGEQFRTVAPSEPYVREVDSIQYGLRSGPCVDAILEETTFRTGDLEGDPRWPAFGQRAAAVAGVRSMLALRLFFADFDESDRTVSSLNLYSKQRDSFDDRSVLLGSIFAAHAAVAVAGAQAQQQIDTLRQAQQSNREIGMAMGVLMSRHGLTQDQAFALLRTASQHSHRKLRDIASDVVHTGLLDVPGLAG